MANEETKALISGEDIKNIEEFFSHFRIEVPSYLKEQLDIFKADPGAYTADKQAMLKAELAHTIVSSDHELMTDGVFSNICLKCDKEWFETQFNRDLESELSEPKKS